MARLTVADAGALIAYLDPGDAHHADAVQGLIDVDQFLVHPVTLAEVLVHPARHCTESAVLNTLISIGMRESQMRVDAVALARLRAESGLKMPDCLVLATAIWHGTDVLTFVAQLKSVANAQSGEAL